VRKKFEIAIESTNLKQEKFISSSLTFIDLTEQTPTIKSLIKNYGKLLINISPKPKKIVKKKAF